jgi:hypothetical protein
VGRSRTKPRASQLAAAMTALVLASSTYAESDDWNSPLAVRPPGLYYAGFVQDDAPNQTVLLGGVDLNDT